MADVQVTLSLPVLRQQQVPIQIALRLLARFVADAVLAEWLTVEAVGLSRNTRAQESAEMRNFDRV